MVKFVLFVSYCIVSNSILLYNSMVVSFTKRMVTVNYRHKQNDSEHLSFIPDYHRSYDPLQYPLIYPCGQDGWHFDCNHTCLQHTSFQLMERKDKEGHLITNPILRGKSLTNQYWLNYS